MQRLMLLSMTAALTLGSLPCRADDRDEPFGPPLRSDEGRYLLDRADEMRWQFLRQESSPAVRPIQPIHLEFHPETLSPELKQIQRALGGSVVDQVGQLQGPPESTSASALGTAEDDDRQRIKIYALREAAWQLDSAAHRLESLDLFHQADALRDQARQLRLDARSMIQGQTSQPASSPLSSPVDSTAPR